MLNWSAVIEATQVLAPQLSPAGFGHFDSEINQVNYTMNQTRQIENLLNLPNLFLDHLCESTVRPVLQIYRRCTERW